MENLPAERTPDAIGRHLEDDLLDCAAEIEETMPKLREKTKRPRSRAAHRIAVSELEAARALRSAPWFGYLAVEENGEDRVFRVGKRSLPKLRIVSWKHPLANVLYDERPGDPYSRPGGRRRIDGTLEARARITQADDCVITTVSWADDAGSLKLRRDGDVFVDAEGEGGPLVSSTQGLSDILAYITREQWQLIAGANDQPLIIQGKAGSGKTTVGLHRVAWLTRDAVAGTAAGAAAETHGEHRDGAAAHAPDSREEERDTALQPENVLIVMFNRALRQFVRQSLDALGLEDARLETFHAWALGTIQAVYGGKLNIDTDALPGITDEDERLVQQLKARRGILDAIERYVERQTARVDAWLAEKLAPYDDAWLQAWRESDGGVAQRLICMRRRALEARENATRTRQRQILDQVYRVFRHAVRRIRLYKEDLRNILTDEDLLAATLTEGHAGPEVREQVATLARYQDLRQRKGAPAGRALGHTVDFSDLALLLRIMQLKHGGLPTADEEVFHFDHLLIDEAQDFGAVELAVLLDAVESRSGVTIVGDVNQKIVPGVDFIGWDAVAAELGIDGARVARLQVGHRSSAPIVAACDAIVGAPADAEPARPGVLPTAHETESLQDTIERVAELIETRLDERDDVHIAVVTRHRRTAKSLLEPLRAAMPELATSIREGHNRKFKFESGISVTNLRQIKGLEFDTVILVECDAGAYPDTEQGRRDFYVACSRAQERLHFVGDSLSSPLLSELVDAGLVERHEPAIPEVELDDELVPF